MSVAGALWDSFVERGREVAGGLERGFDEIGIAGVDAPAARDRLLTLAGAAFELGIQALLLGAEDLGRLALACERGFDLLVEGRLAAHAGYPVLASCLHTLARAFVDLSRHDRSGARTAGLPLAAARYELETLFPVPGGESAAAPALAPDVPVSALVRRPAPAVESAAAAASPPSLSSGPLPNRAAVPRGSGAVSDPVSDPGGDGRVWVPHVDDDMVELYFDEVDERLEELAMRLLELEQQPEDAELVRGVFRDLHTIKGSSAMVGLDPMHGLAHAAEDLVGHLREGRRRVDGAVIDALLAALDGLRDIAALARGRQLLDADLSAILARLREPHAPATGAGGLGPGGPSAAGGDAADGDETGPDGETKQDSGSKIGGRTGAVGLGAGRAEATRPTIRVDFDKLDRLMNLVGELVLGRDGLRGAVQSLGAVAGELERGPRQAARAGGAERALAALSGELSRIDRVLGDITLDMESATDRLDAVSAALRDQVMKLRMVPVRGVFRKHHRTVRDLAAALGKEVRLVLEGEDTELDKVLVEALDEPLMHLVRNAVDHGVEPAAERRSAGKPGEGEIRLAAAYEGNQVVIRIGDDGRGLDPRALRARARERGLVDAAAAAALDDREALELIFRPGFSTAKAVSEVSGRGVGMDVVRQTVVHELKGSIDIDAVPGRGTTFTLRLPLTLAIIQVVLARAGGEVFAIPLDGVVRTLACRLGDIAQVQDQELVVSEGRHVPLLRLDRVLGLEGDLYLDSDELAVVLVDVGSERYGLVCDHLLGKKEIVIKSLGPLLTGVPCAAGATLLGERCVLILDVPGLVERARRGDAVQRPGAARAGGRMSGSEPGAEAPAHILLAEDSDTVRESLRRLLVKAGWRVTTARDGVEALAAAERERFDLVSTDVMMPRMDGYELTRALRARPDYHDTPIVMITSRGERIDQVRGFDAGVDEYITKPHDRALLVGAVRALLAGRQEPKE
ncbi:hybrid sensor histidine kinase/response regulator [Haliangium sp.]|uniref:hybrid sensor histidine kinase/response regulator n=1 Tax=Haliangium sp. TaxID=2663208 RepID=UPI003D11D84A